MADRLTLYTVADLSRYCVVANSAMSQRFKRGTLPTPVAATASGRPLWSTKQADEIRKDEYRKRIDITGI